MARPSRRDGALLAAVLVGLVLSLATASSELQHAHRLTDGGANTELIDAEKDSVDSPRTATGGIIHTLLVTLTICSFIGNAIFLVNVFWLSK